MLVCPSSPTPYYPCALNCLVQMGFGVLQASLLYIQNGVLCMAVCSYMLGKAIFACCNSERNETQQAEYTFPDR